MPAPGAPLEPAATPLEPALAESAARPHGDSSFSVREGRSESPRVDAGAPVGAGGSPAGSPMVNASMEETIRRVRLARGGDPEAFSDLVREYQTLALRTARALVGNVPDAEDVAQEAFLRLYRHLAKLDPDRDPTGWVYRLTVHCAWDLLKKRRRERGLVDNLRADARPPFQASSEGGAAAAEIRQILTRSLQALPRRVRTVFVLREIEGLEVVEVARVLRITRITVRRHLSRARASLQRLLQESHPELLEK